MSTPAPATSPSWVDRLIPFNVTAWVRRLGLASVLVNLLLVITGGLVRLTGSGLGCPTWPRCTDETWTNVPAMGIHGFIEFGNRTLTGAVGIVALATFIAVWRLRGRYTDLFYISLALGVGVIVQAIVGGFSVLVRLNPWMVGVHFMLSGIMIAMASIFYARARRYSLRSVIESERLSDTPGPDNVQRALGFVIAVLSTVVVYMGTLVTGTGPHSGDASSARHAFNPETVTRFHSVPVWALMILLVVTFILAKKRLWAPAVSKNIVAIFVVMLFQGAIGYTQYFTGSPSSLVWLHLVGAGLLIATVTFLFERMVVLGTPALRQLAESRVDIAEANGIV
ncbi:COX15/CtaA family protein [Kocuria sp. HSID16901]|uniref:COX15/CtaA family protein n=1 Tax=Kocuria sp. HSID16901 TaxID=2419505 RepID=UPI00069E6B42|nr:COX15/CtaA family protein [Kocuria sp. HSID16901]RUQ22561.1 heme A synthase [Kocuria sp. HSID16901]